MNIIGIVRPTLGSTVIPPVMVLPSGLNSMDFKPDLKLFLTKSKASSLTGKNATKNAVRIAKLTSNKGAQRYKLPNNINPADFTTLLIHCEKYSKLWATGNLN